MVNIHNLFIVRNPKISRICRRVRLDFNIQYQNKISYEQFDYFVNVTQ